MFSLLLKDLISDFILAVDIYYKLDNLEISLFNKKTLNEVFARADATEDKKEELVSNRSEQCISMQNIEPAKESNLLEKLEQKSEHTKQGKSLCTRLNR